MHLKNPSAKQQLNRGKTEDTPDAAAPAPIYRKTAAARHLGHQQALLELKSISSCVKS
jgi:hypothetical protein